MVSQNIPKLTGQNEDNGEEEGEPRNQTSPKPVIEAGKAYKAKISVRVVVSPLLFGHLPNHLYLHKHGAEVVAVVAKMQTE